MPDDLDIVSPVLLLIWTVQLLLLPATINLCSLDLIHICVLFSHAVTMPYNVGEPTSTLLHYTPPKRMVSSLISSTRSLSYKGGNFRKTTPTSYKVVPVNRLMRESGGFHRDRSGLRCTENSKDRYFYGHIHKSG